jgi:hypothetical protein
LLLRNLDQRADNGKYNLLIATDHFAMRGLDYRAPILGVTLILAASFANKREALQGLKRVGRFGDPSVVVSIEDIPLIDKEKESHYHTILFAYLFEQENKTNSIVQASKEKGYKKGERR